MLNAFVFSSPFSVPFSLVLLSRYRSRLSPAVRRFIAETNTFNLYTYMQGF
jgi:hypothetical protein